jgi:hypothetical protein
MLVLHVVSSYDATEMCYNSGPTFVYLPAEHVSIILLLLLTRDKLW